jgi:hypothetical protein
MENFKHFNLKFVDQMSNEDIFYVLDSVADDLLSEGYSEHEIIYLFEYVVSDYILSDTTLLSEKRVYGDNNSDLGKTTASRLDKRTQRQNRIAASTKDWVDKKSNLRKFRNKKINFPTVGKRVPTKRQRLKDFFHGIVKKITGNGGSSGDNNKQTKKNKKYIYHEPDSQGRSTKSRIVRSKYDDNEPSNSGTSSSRRLGSAARRSGTSTLKKFSKQVNAAKQKIEQKAQERNKKISSLRKQRHKEKTTVNIPTPIQAAQNRKKQELLKKYEPARTGAQRVAASHKSGELGFKNRTSSPSSPLSSTSRERTNKKGDDGMNQKFVPGKKPGTRVRSTLSKRGIAFNPKAANPVTRGRPQAIASTPEAKARAASPFSREQRSTRRRGTKEITNPITSKPREEIQQRLAALRKEEIELIFNYMAEDFVKSGCVNTYSDAMVVIDNLSEKMFEDLVAQYLD